MIAVSGMRDGTGDVEYDRPLSWATSVSEQKTGNKTPAINLLTSGFVSVCVCQKSTVLEAITDRPLFDPVQWSIRDGARASNLMDSGVGG